VIELNDCMTKLPERCTAAVLEQFQQPVRMREFALPRQFGAGELLMKVEMAGMCGTDVHLHRGELKIPLPVILGHETVGRIAAIGGARRDWLGNELHVGDRITFTVGRTCGECRYCRVYKLPSRCLNRKAYGVTACCAASPHLLGGYGQYHFLHADAAVFRVPDDLRTETLVGAGCALVTVIHGLERLPVRWGESVVVQGAGPVGLAAVAMAKDGGAQQVIAIGAPAARLERCRQFGANMTIGIDDVHDANLRRQMVLDATHGLGADMVIECVGKPEAVAEGWELCRDGGKYLVLGQYCDAGPVLLNPHLIVRKELTIAGSYGSQPEHWARAIDFLRARSDRYPFHELITHRFALEQVNEALAAVASGETGKAVICP
jgi:threonine dehydrogenase-like Zn-dependent dehydrogenase